jgi:serine/threonine protein kinase/tetratricopeptide (TPR) repeat protein
MSEGQDKLEALFDAAVQLKPEERAAYLAQACGNDQDLRGRVERLLRNLDRAGNFLTQAEGAPSDQVAGLSLTSERPGDRIGRYKLLERIGEGGCGVVYMAQQEEPVRRRVALKIIKLGMDTRSVIARFEAERQALALMDHPNIAKVHDAGATETGRPYFVMELVRGVKITEYCDEKNLSTVQRLDLFVKVCQAVQHAHQKGIIHRDIKPTNTLVTVNDGVAVPKIIDFGIAKATTDQRLTDKTVFTAFEQFIGTPAYMSPEQAELTSVDIDTRSDIYSLGVLLYELLTGKTPFDSKELLQAGLDEMRRTIRDKEPPTPSTRVSTMHGDELTTTAKRRGLEPPKLINQLRGDLDWIVMKCLEKDRARRYETANGLAMDIQRHLTNEPVLASPPSAFYRLQKLVRRNQVLYAAAGAVLLALVLGLGLSTFLFMKERAGRREQARLRQRSESEAAKSQQVAQFLKDMLAGVGPSVALGRDTTMLREILEKTAERVSKELTNQPEVALDLRETIAKTYWDLGLYKEMENIALGSVNLARASFGEESLAVVNELALLGNAQWGLTHFNQAEATEREALRLRHRIGGKDDLELAEALNSLGLVLEAQDKLREAEPFYREALALLRKLRGNEHPDVATSLYNLGNLLASEGKLDEAVATQREALAMRRKLLGTEHPDVAMSLNSLGGCFERQGNLGEAETTLREVLEVQRKLYGNEHRFVALSLCNLASTLRDEGKLADAEAHLREALAIVRKVLGDDHADVPSTIYTLAEVLCDEGKLAEAETLSREALAMNRKLLGDEHWDVSRTLGILVSILRREGKLAEAETLCREQVAQVRAHPRADERQLGEGLWQLTTTLLMEEKFVEAEPAARECLSIYEKELPNSWRTSSGRCLVGTSLLGNQKYAEAEPLLLSAYEGLNKPGVNAHLDVKASIKDVLERLVQLYQATGRSDQATQWKQKLERFHRDESSTAPSAPSPAKPPP